MTFRKVEMVAVECDSCGAHGPPRRNHEHAEAAAQLAEVPITPITFTPASRHVCQDCRAAIAEQEAKKK